MLDPAIGGQFVWHDLKTPQINGANAFYSKVMGWQTQPRKQDPSYSMFVAPSGPLGGLICEPAGIPQWVHYIDTPDLDASIELATARGGQVITAATQIVGGGRHAMLADPQGAVFGLYEWPADGAAAIPAARGPAEFSWYELAANDQQAAFGFYAELFGWERLLEHDMDAEGAYVIFGRGEHPVGGMFTKPASMPGPPAWLGYVRVRDLHAAVAKAQAARGTLLVGPMEIPGGDWIAQLLDPYGAPFAIHVAAADVKAAKASARRSIEVASGRSIAKKTAAGGKKRSEKKPAVRRSAAARTRKVVSADQAISKTTRKTGKAVKNKTARKSATPTTGKGVRKAAVAASPGRRTARKTTAKSGRVAKGAAKQSASARRPAARKATTAGRKAAPGKKAGTRKIARATKTGAAKKAAGARTSSRKTGAGSRATRSGGRKRR